MMQNVSMGYVEDSLEVVCTLLKIGIERTIKPHDFSNEESVIMRVAYDRLARLLSSVKIESY